VRDWDGKNPVRIVLDRTLKLDSTLDLFDHSQKTICYNQVKSENSENLDFVKLDSGFGLEHVLEDLYQRKIQSLIVEGGAQVLKSFIENELWDEARVFTGQVQFGKGIPAPIIQGEFVSESTIMGDRLAVWRHLESEVQPVPFFREG
jgi:diaminohydroxyphosphoribosylaminopyrimidine deaminase/5-amino-6-(5-phosphoribosylamino)uracil reductase